MNRGSPSTSSCVALTRSSGGVGCRALAGLDEWGPCDLVVHDIKRLMGRAYDDPHAADYGRRRLLAVVRRGDEAVVGLLPEEAAAVEAANGIVGTPGQGDADGAVWPEEICAVLVAKLKRMAPRISGNARQGCRSYRQAIKNACKIAGLRVIRILNETSAVGMAYCFQNPSLRENISLVFHLGGGTFDASIMVTENGVIEVNSTSGDSHIGGVDFDAMVHHSIDKDFQMRYNGDLTGSTKSMRRLFMACERAKRALSSQVQVSIELDKLFEDVDYHTTMTRAKFEDLNADLFKSIFGVVEKVLQESQYSKTSINDVILVGGSSRIPKVQQMLQEFFTSSELTIMAPDSAAYGAALEAAILSGIHNPQLIEMLLVDVTPHTLGIETAGGVMTPLIRKNTLLPTNRTQIFSTFEDNQPTVTIKVYEGEETLTKNCTLLGKFSLSGIPPAPKGDPHINVKFCINTDGALDVTASDKKTGHSNKVTVTNTNKRGHTLLANPGEDEGKYSW